MFLGIGGDRNMITETAFVPTSLKNDMLFKEVLAHPQNKDKLIYFLSCFTDYGEEYLKKSNLKVTYERQLPKANVKNKTFRGDIIVEFDNITINLECYSTFVDEYLKKSLAYIMRLYSTNLNRGESYEKLKTVLGINFIDNVRSSKLSKEMYNNVSLVLNYKNELYNSIKLEIYRLDIAKKAPYNKNDKKLKWLKFIGADNYEERKTIAKGDKKLMELNEWTQGYITDANTRKFFADWDRKITYGIGLEDGEIKGKKLGQLESTNSIAKEMIKKSYSTKEIQEITKLSLQEINDLKEEMK